jgi:hypothetical protein
VDPCAERQVPGLRPTEVEPVGLEELRGVTIRSAHDPYLKMLSGRNAETIQFGASTISLIRRSAATLATT